MLTSRRPLILLALSFSTIADAAQAISRLNDVFEAELLETTRTIDPSIENALEVKGASFTWDAPPPDEEESKRGKGKKGKGGKKSKKPSPSSAGDGSEKEKDDDKVFKIPNVTLSIPRGQLVAIVGPVGSGKTSLLQGLIGEMRKTSGSVMFGGSVGYCAQTAWIQVCLPLMFGILIRNIRSYDRQQNATIRENICFGRPFEEEKYWNAVRAACLEPDLEMLPYGDMTEVGEKGISLSGGQKQRINICRAIYSDTEIQIFDVSAFPSHIGLGSSSLTPLPIIGSPLRLGRARWQSRLPERSPRRPLWKNS